MTKPRMISGSKNLRYLSFGTRTYAEKPVIARARGWWEFEFIFNGRARPTGVDSSTPEGDKPRLYIFHPDSPHGWTDDDGGFSEIFVVHFSDVPDELKETIQPTKPIHVELDAANVRRMASRLQEVHNATIADDMLTSLKLHQLLVEMTILALGKKGDAHPPVEPADKVARAIHWLEENIGEGPSVEDAARAVGISAAHLRRLFSKAGIPSPQAELTRLRLAAAKRCLKEGWKQEKIAAFLGFSEASAFARAFRDASGQTPGGWLAQNRG